MGNGERQSRAAIVEPVPARERMGRYEIAERIGLGGMAVVHRARDLARDGRPVALKRLLPHLAADRTFVKAFIREGRLAALLDHPNIVRLRERGKSGAAYYIALELVEGADLRRILKHSLRIRTRPPAAVVVEILRQLCRALGYAHALRDAEGRPLGIVHRDISPSNVLVTPAGVVKVIDFGIAQVAARNRHSESGNIKGKLPYIAPEAFRGELLDQRSDLFSVAVLAHELLTAQPLFAGRDDYGTIHRVQHLEVPPPSLLNPDCPAALDAIVLRGLARAPAERFQSAAELGAALDDLITSHRLPTGPSLAADWIAWALAQAPRPRPAGRPEALAPELELHDASDEAIEEAVSNVWDSAEFKPVAPRGRQRRATDSRATRPLRRSAGAPPLAPVPKPIPEARPSPAAVGPVRMPTTPLEPEITALTQLPIDRSHRLATLYVSGVLALLTGLVFLLAATAR